MAPKLGPGTPVLLVRRISRDTEQSSALVRQAQDLARAAAEKKYSVVDQVEDATVSGAVNLDERESLGPWVREGEPKWDAWTAIMMTSVDRLTRDQYHWESFAERCHQAGKEILVLDDPALDIHTPTGRMIAYVRATVAMEYRQKIVEKRTNQLEYYRQESLWPGGQWPFGFRAVEYIHQGRKRWRLEPDPVTSALVREAYERIALQSWTMNMLGADWSTRGVLTSADYQRAAHGKPTRGTKWSTSALGKALRNPVLKGIAMHEGAPLLRDGLPVRWAEPILTDEEFALLQACLDALGQRYGAVKGTADPMNGVLMCGCGRRLHASRSRSGTGRVYEYYRCASVTEGGECPLRRSWPRGDLLGIAEDAFLRRVGGEEVSERLYIPGVDNRAKIAELEAAIDNLAQSVAQAASPVVVDALTRTMERHAATLEDLKAEPVVPGRFEETGTGQDFAEKWHEMTDWSSRGPFLLRSGFRIFTLPPIRVEEPYASVWVVTPRDVLREARDAVSGAPNPGSTGWDKTAYGAFLMAVKEDLRPAA